MKSPALSRFAALRNMLLLAACGAVLAGCQSMGGNAGVDADNTSYKRMVTQGPATKIINPNIYPDCTAHNPRMNIRKSAVGQITATDGTVITVPNKQLKLKPGMTANVKIEIAKRTNTLRIPNAALRFRPTTEMFTAFKQEPPPELTAFGGAGGGRGGPGGGRPGGGGRGGN